MTSSQPASPRPPSEPDREDDRTLESWLRNHRRYFQRLLASIDLEFHEQMETMFEPFHVVWPPEYADAAS